MKKYFKTKLVKTQRETEKSELFSARVASVAITVLGVVSVLAFASFPTVYEAHGFFHSTLTPPLVVAIFLGVFWRKFTPAAVIATFVGGVALMILGNAHPGVLIAPFDHGIPMDPNHPYSYIRALYNTFVCLVIGVAAALTTGYQKKFVDKIKASSSHSAVMTIISIIAVIIFILVFFNIGSLAFLFISSIVLSVLVSLIVTYYVKYDEFKNTDGLTAWSIQRAKELFKGGRLNESEGEKVTVNWKLKDGDDGVINFSHNDMKKMAAEQGDLVYLDDSRWYLGGLKSIHSKFGEPHSEDGIVYINNEQLQTGVFLKGKPLKAEKEM